MRLSKILSFLGALLMSASLSATHLLGGEIYWECTSSGDYIFTLVLYRDCTGISMPGSNQTINGPAGNITVSRVSVTDVSPQCPDPAIALDCNAGDPGAIEKGVWRSSPVSLSGTPPAGGWEFSWSSCCRPTLENTGASSYYLRSKMYPYTPAGNQNPISVNTCYDNSPVFAQDANGVTCAGFPYTFNHLPSDKDVDSLVFDWADPLENANQAISFDQGFSNTAPFPDGTENPSNGPNQLDPSSGEMKTEVYNPNPGWYASSVKISEYRCGQLIGEVYRDVPFHFLDPTKCAANASTPSVEIDTSVYTNISRNGNIYRTRVFPEDSVNFRLTGQDLDQFNNGTFQTICMKAGGLQLNANDYTSTTGCNGAAPCATINSKNSNGTYCNTIQNTVEFNWKPTCTHLSTGSCGSATNTYFFTIKMSDNGCAANKEGLATVIVEVIAGEFQPPRFTCLSSDLSGAVTMSWEEVPFDASMDSALKILGFNYYSVEASTNNNGPWTMVDSIPDSTTVTTTIDSATIASNGYQYFRVRYNTGPCEFFSQPSQVRQISQLSMNAIPPGSPEVAQLSWTAMNMPPLPANPTYEIWIEAPAMSGNWKKVGETSQTSYDDTVSVCDLNVAYQIRVRDTVLGCFSGTSMDSATFEDETNTEIPNMTHAEVDSNGRTLLYFNTDTVDTDIIAFQLLYNDPQNGWVIVDTIPPNSPMPYSWPGSQADGRSEEVKVVSLDSCDNASDDLLSQAHKTVYLRNRLNKCDGSSRLSWNAYEEFPNGVDGYRLLVQITEPDGTRLPLTPLFEGGPDDTTFLQRTVERGYKYCYVVEAYDTAAGLTSRSNIECVEAEVLQKSKQLYIAQVSNDHDRDALDLRVYIDGKADVRSFQFERAPTYYGPYEVISTANKPQAPPYIVNFQDFGVDPATQNYYYRVTALDSCGGRDTISNISRNIRMKVEPREDLANRLSWNSYESWLGEVDRYEVYRRKGPGQGFSKIAETDGTDTVHVDFEVSNIVQSEEKASDLCYYVKAVEGNNPQGLVTNTGAPYSAKSNIGCATQGARVFVPTAFRPGSSVNRNKTFGPSVELADLDSYRFYVVNRWGKKVFETEDPNRQWDGSYESGMAPAGVYLYYLSYATPGGQQKVEQGSFTLIR